MNIISTPQIYANIWEEESNQFEALGLYSSLTNYLDSHSPNGKILEFGCGTGLATRHLAENHEVLCLDNNIDLLEIAKKNLEKIPDKVQFHQCDFFELTENDLTLIQNFAPDVVIGWNIGTCGQVQEERASKHLNVVQKTKDYREKVEDIIMKISSDLESVKIVNLVIRSQLNVGYNFEEAEKSQLENYNEYVFDINEKSKFKSKSAKALEWDNSSSNMNYVVHGSPSNLTIPLIISIVAERKEELVDAEEQL